MAISSIEVLEWRRVRIAGARWSTGFSVPRAHWWCEVVHEEEPAWHGRRDDGKTRRPWHGLLRRRALPGMQASPTPLLTSVKVARSHGQKPLLAEGSTSGGLSLSVRVSAAVSDSPPLSIFLVALSPALVPPCPPCYQRSEKHIGSEEQGSEPYGQDHGPKLPPPSAQLPIGGLAAIGLGPEGSPYARRSGQGETEHEESRTAPSRSSFCAPEDQRWIIRRPPIKDFFRR